MAPKLSLVPNWKRVLKSAWSVRFNLLAILFGGIEAGLPLLEGVLPIPQGAFGLLMILATMGSLGSRFISQKSVSGGQSS